MNLQAQRNKIKLNREFNSLTISECLRTRKFLKNQIILISDIISVVVVFSIILMITMNELSFIHINHLETQSAWFIKLSISITTLILLILIIYYHYLDLKLYANHNGLKHASIGLTNMKIGSIFLELFICMLHPIPRAYPQSNSIKSNSTIPESYPLSHIVTDVGLSLPMFLRLYLLTRSIMFHSYLFRDSWLRSFGYLNHVSINFSFVIKTFFARWPTRSLILLCMLIFLIGSWSLRACNYEQTREHFTLLDSMWIFVITFTTVGYGDIYPTTYCGRTISAIIGLVGLLASALLIAVLSQKLHFTHAEKYVHTFVLNINLTKQQQHQAANVIKFAIKLWYLHRKDREKYLPYILVQRKLFQAIHLLKNIKHKQRTRILQQHESIFEIQMQIKNIEEKLDMILGKETK